MPLESTWSISQQGSGRGKGIPSCVRLLLEFCFFQYLKVLQENTHLRAELDAARNKLKTDLPQKQREVDELKRQVKAAVEDLFGEKKRSKERYEKLKEVVRRENDSVLLSMGQNVFRSTKVHRGSCERFCATR